MLTALPQLVVLDLYSMYWADDALSAGPTILVASLPRLRVFSAPNEALVPAQCMPELCCLRHSSPF